MLPIEKDIKRLQSKINKHNSGDPENYLDDETLQAYKESLELMKDDLTDYKLQQWKDAKYEKNT